MQTWIALFCGINVGGNNILPMAGLRVTLESLGLSNVRTHIQSGNVVFDFASEGKDAIGKEIMQRVEEEHGFRPHVLLLSPEDFRRAVESNPFPNAVAEPKTLHFFFLAEPITCFDRAPLEAAKSSTEHFELIEHVFYLHAPDGIGRSKLAAKVEEYLGVAGTGRNYRTVEKVLAMLVDR